MLLRLMTEQILTHNPNVALGAQPIRALTTKLSVNYVIFTSVLFIMRGTAEVGE